LQLAGAAVMPTPVVDAAIARFSGIPRRA
jgi:hypothetical protein